MTTATSSSVAFKEWASVVDALATGEQILILRKGGIHEKGKKFNVLHESFFLFPTYEHQNTEDLNSRGQQLLKQVVAKRKGANPEDLPIEIFAEVKESFWIDDFKKLLNLHAFHVLSENALRKRFEWSDTKGLYALVVRIYKLPSRQHLQNLPAYGGCRSWVELNAAIDLSELSPVLKNSDFETQVIQIKQTLINT